MTAVQGEPHMTGLMDRTVFPPHETEGMRELENFVNDVPIAELRGPSGNTIALPAEVYDVLRDVVDALAHGHAITVAPRHQRLTTQQAADLLGISRPTLVRLLQDGHIPYTQPGRHRRVMLHDVLDYQRRSHEDAQAGLDEMVEISEDAGLYDDDVTTKRLRR